MDKSDKYNVSDFITCFLEQMRCNTVHGLMGGGAAGLNDAFIRNTNIKYLCYHHEQAAGYAAIGEARLTKRWSILNPTTGCGGTNCYTPLLNAWQDSLPLIVISGNVNLQTCTLHLNSNHDLELRSYGVQEHDIIKTVKPITKYAVMLQSPDEIGELLLNAFKISAEGRKGPCWIDVPADLQHSAISTALMKSIPSLITKLFSSLSAAEKDEKVDCTDAFQICSSSQRPLVLIGGGIANDIKEKQAVESFILKHNLPVVSTYAATDVVAHDYENYLGAIGIKGNRAANFAVQNCDTLIVLGSRLPFAAIGYDVDNFAKNAQIIAAEIDENEIQKNTLNFDKRIHHFKCKASNFLDALSNIKFTKSTAWDFSTKSTKQRWEIIKENKSTYNYDGISIYHVMEELNNKKFNNCNFVVDAGSISYVAPTALKYTISRNFIFSPAQADMGCALPSALGVAANSEKHTICITGDGSFMSNMQELATLAYHDYPITVIVLNNAGYLSISNTQRNNYGDNRMYGEHDGRGLMFPNYKKLCETFGLRYMNINKQNELNKLQEHFVGLVEIKCLDAETIAPYQARIAGKQAGAHDMAPFLPKDELEKYATTNLKFER